MLRLSRPMMSSMIKLQLKILQRYGFTNQLDLTNSTYDHILRMATSVGQQGVIHNHHDLSVT